MFPVVESADSDTASNLNMRKFKPEVFYQATMPNEVDDYQLITYGNEPIRNLPSKSFAGGLRASTMHSLKSKGDIYDVHGFDDSEIEAI